MGDVFASFGLARSSAMIGTECPVGSAQSRVEGCFEVLVGVGAECGPAPNVYRSRAAPSISLPYPGRYGQHPVHFGHRQAGGRCCPGLANKKPYGRGVWYSGPIRSCQVTSQHRDFVLGNPVCPVLVEPTAGAGDGGRPIKLRALTRLAA